MTLKTPAIVLAALMMTSVAGASPADLELTSGTATLTIKDRDATLEPTSVISLDLEWQSDSGGAMSAQTQRFAGRLMRVVTIPGYGGANPTGDYSLTITDQGGLDLLGGMGADRDTSDTQEIYPMVSIASGATTISAPVVFFGPLQIEVTGTSTSAAGLARIFVER